MPVKYSAVIRAEAALRKALAAELNKEVARVRRSKVDAELRAKRSAEKAAAAESRKLSRIVGLTVTKTEFLPSSEGVVRITFTDGTVFELSASGDDATYVTYSLKEAR